MAQLEPRRALLAAAKAAGLGVRFLPDAGNRAELRHREQAVVVDVAWVPRIAAAALGELSSGPLPLVLATPKLSSELLRAAATAGASVIDLAGNAHLDLPGLLVHVEGRAAAPRRPGRPAELGANTARVLRVLLAERHPVVRCTRRELAARAGLALATVQRQLEALAGQGWLHLDGSEIVLTAPAELLRTWEHLYATALRPELVCGAARPVGVDVGAWARRVTAEGLVPGLLLGGSVAAAALGANVVPDSATVHVEQRAADALPALLRHVGLVPDPAGPIPLVRVPGEVEGAGGVVDLPSVLGELLLLPEARLDAVRRELRQQLLAPLAVGSAR